jgi:hypothetical protein
MKLLISLLIIFGLVYVGKQLTSKYQEAKKNSLEAQQEGSGAHQSAPVSSLPGMPPTLEPALDAAKKQGAAGLGTFLKQYSYTIRDPRLADIELDYVVMLSLQNPSEARTAFQAVQQRTPPSSPVYGRVKKLEKNFQ